MHARRTAALVLTAALFIVGCSTGGDTTTAGESASVTKSTTPPPEPAPPRGACYDLRQPQLDAAHDDSPVVKCGNKHTTQTYAVMTLSAKTVGDPEAVNTERIARVAEQRCSTALRKHLGGKGETFALSRFRSAWFVPEENEIARGARWLRCDVAADHTESRLAKLPNKSKNLLAPSDALDKWGTCAKANARRLEAGKGQRMCAAPHNWRAVATHRLGTQKDSWPGAKTVGKNVLDRCEKPVRSFTDNETEATRVGWLPPTRQQWRAGQRYGTCWARTG